MYMKKGRGQAIYLLRLVLQVPLQVELKDLRAGPNHPWGLWGWSLRAQFGAWTARYKCNENLQSRPTLGPKISGEKICFQASGPRGTMILLIWPCLRGNFMTRFTWKKWSLNGGSRGSWFSKIMFCYLLTLVLDSSLTLWLLSAFRSC